MNKPSLHLIGGPTASGKTALALELARRTRGLIINADAMQVYAGLPLLTAQPTFEEKKICPHKLFEIFDPSERSSVGTWLELAQDAICQAVKMDYTPIVVGGSGLYFRALTEGLADIPPIPEEIRAEAISLYDERGSETFRAALAIMDKESSEKIKPNDKQRLIRAYEVVKYTGKPLQRWQEEMAGHNPLASRFTIHRHLLMPEREVLYALCDARFLRMIENGAIEEVRNFLKRKLDPNLPAMKVLGFREIAAYVRRELSLDEAVLKAQQFTRNYAKRQMTWFRNQWEERESAS